jgi:hypothetical protein
MPDFNKRTAGNGHGCWLAPDGKHTKMIDMVLVEKDGR